MSVAWKKAWRDLTHDKARALQVVLSTTVGLLTLGLAVGMRDLAQTRIVENYEAAFPAHITFYLSSFDQDVAEAVLREAGVADAEGEIRVGLRWKFEGETEWRDGALIARPDYDAQRVNRVELLEGAWPTHRDVGVENLTSQYFGLRPGVTIITDSGRRGRPVRIESVVRSGAPYPPQFGSPAVFFATPETVSWLTGRDGFNRLTVRLESFDHDGASATARRIRDRLERMGMSVGSTNIADPDDSLQDEANAALLALTVMGALSLGMSAFLIVNTMNAIVARETWQIGVMKVLGAAFGGVVWVYLESALMYGVLALLAAVPLSAAGAHLIAGHFLSLINVDIGPFRVMPGAVAVQVAVGLAVPVAAALVPVIRGARITPHEALGSYGLGSGFGRGPLDRLLRRLRCLPRPLALSLRNTFRRKGRLALTLLALTFGGLMFIAVTSLRVSLNHTIEVIMEEYGDDVWVGFERLHPVERLVNVAEQVPGVTVAEVWAGFWSPMSLSDSEECDVHLMAVPPDSEILQPRIVSGRWLHPDDGRAIVVSAKIAVDEGVVVGDLVTFGFDEHRSTWTVVGVLVFTSDQGHTCFVPFDALARETGTINRGRYVEIKALQHDARSHEALTRALREAFAKRNLDVSWTGTNSEMREEHRAQFNVLVYLLLVIPVLAAAAGGIGLLGTMSLNVIERGREIGVMRAVGATSPVIIGILVSEGMLLGTLSWLLAVPMSYPVAYAFSRAIGYAVMRVPLEFRFSTGGVVLWLVIVLTVSAVGSLWPALRATRVSVWEALAYE